MAQIAAVGGARGGVIVADANGEVWFARYLTPKPGTQQWFYVGKAPEKPELADGVDDKGKPIMRPAVAGEKI